MVRRTLMLRLVTLIILLVMLVSCEQRDTRTVVVIKKTDSYHRLECAKVNMAETTTMSLDSAIAHRMRPCPYCRPDSEL